MKHDSNIILKDTLKMTIAIASLHTLSVGFFLHDNVGVATT